jgi:hypothetical protein
MRLFLILGALTVSVALPLLLTGWRVWAQGDSWGSVWTISVPFLLVGPAVAASQWWFGTIGQLRRTQTLRRVRLLDAQSAIGPGRTSIVRVAGAGQVLEWPVVLPLGSAPPSPGRVWATEPFAADQRIALIVNEPVGKKRHVLEPRDRASSQ